MEKFLLIQLITIIIITLTNSQTPQNQDCPKERCQSNGQCVDNISLCPVAISCPAGFVKTNQFTCAIDAKTEQQSSNCPTNQYTCWDKSCKDSQSECPSMPTCPSTNTVRCPDNSCVRSLDDCPKYVKCPTYIPIRCPNGDCRTNLKDCPGLIKCPAEFSVMCNDGSCRMTSDECDLPSIQTQCNDQTMTRCPDGSCTSSKFLCPSTKACSDGFVMCWNGTCAPTFAKCEKPTLGQSNSCSNSLSVRCALDGSCNANLSECPTAMICPTEKPVRCWDFSCQETLSKCPKFQECPDGTRRCNDGTCSATTSCGTHITCSMDAPFKCYDNTCRRDPTDCPSAPECPRNTPILCWDGKCVGNRVDCLPPDSCPAESVKCPDNMCKTTADECKAIYGCPIGFVRCSDSSCRRKLADCQAQSCPLAFPYQCPDGTCVKNEYTCNDEKTNCPFYAPYKCADGSCVKNSEFEPNPNCKKVTECGVDLKPCPDGSCLQISQICPTLNGCPEDTPYRCADGTCIDKLKSKCPIPTCPPETPVKCLKGFCALSKAFCPTNYESVNHLECPDNLNPCPDGTCTNYPEECKLVFSCPVGFERCPDGSCRGSRDFCPRANTCPLNRPYRCLDGSCSINANLCMNLSGCPQSTPIKCSNTGLCVDSQDKCNDYEDLFPRSNGCDKATPTKCLSGKCVNDKNQCDEKNDCPADQVYCPNTGTCANKIRDCIKLGDTCPDGYIRCSLDGKCKPNYLECTNKSGCPTKTPFRCISGGCRMYPVSTQNKNSDTCDLGIECPDYKPYLCADGSCAQKSSFCLTVWPCPKEKPERCFDRTCVASKDECTKRINCPSTNPILCPISGNCVSNIFDCIDDTCSTQTPYKCGNGRCEKSPRKCVVNEFSNSTICGEKEATCYDGTCRSTIEECPLYSGCTDTKYPYKCKDGSCARKFEECDKPVTQILCTNSTSLCEDGICRIKCPHYGGCPNLKPLMCSSGICVEKLSECAGQSNCPIDKPFRCFSGECTENMSECKRAKRNNVGTDMKMFVGVGKQVIKEIIIGESNDIIGAIVIQENTFRLNSNKTNSQNNTNTTSAIGDPIDVQLQIRSVPTSQLRNCISRYNQTRQDDVIKLFPYADVHNNYTLEYEYSVLSAVIEIKLITGESNIKMNNIIMLELAYDFPVDDLAVINDEDEMKLDPLKDICLAKLSFSKQMWECTTFPTISKSKVNLQLLGGINELGIYAIILSPRPDERQLKIEPNFIAKYLLVILISSAVIGLILFIGIYIFLRIYRYRGKYKESKELIKKNERSMQEMQSFTTTHLGQTVGDTMEGVIYTNNPAYRLIKKEEKNKRVEELQNLEEFMKKKLRTLEKNNDQLKKTYDTIQNEHKRMSAYKNEILKKKDGKIVVSESEEDQ